MTWPALIGLALGITTAVLVALDQHRPPHHPTQPHGRSPVMSTRTRNPKKPTRKTAPAPAALAKLPTRKPLNQRDFITDIQITAAFTAARAGVTYTRITGWTHQADGTAHYDFPNGAALTYTPYAEKPLTALTPCAHGSHHPHPVATIADLRQAQHDATSCTGHTPAIPTPTPEPTAVRTLADTLTRSDSSNEDTQQTDITALRAETPQEQTND